MMTTLFLGTQTDSSIVQQRFETFCVSTRHQFRRIVRGSYDADMRA